MPCAPGSLEDPMAKSHHNWVTQHGGLPRYIERIACHVHFDHGMPIGEAIAVGVADCKKMCATGESNFGHVHAVPQSEACEAIAHWEAMKAAADAGGHKSEESGK
jgi:hypothetical protein